MSKSVDTVIYLGKDDPDTGRLFSLQEFDELNIFQTENTTDLLPYLAGDLQALLVLVDLDLMMNLNYSHAASLFAAGNCAPMIVLIGQFSTKAMKLAMQAGFDEFVSKPLDKEVLMGLLKKAVRERYRIRKLQSDENIKLAK
jgi:FixJ family two-component response regulator